MPHRPDLQTNALASGCGLCEMSGAMPPNWTRYTTEDGKEYFHNSVTNTTQWDKPEVPSMGLETLTSFDTSGASDVFQYRPTAADLELTEQRSSVAPMVAMSSEIQKQPSVESDTVSLTAAPGGRIDTGFGSFGSALGGVVSAATSEDGGSTWALSMLSYAQQFFDVNTDDVVKRLKASLMPNPLEDSGEIHSDFREKPDFWGPFWIATTAVLFLAATGNFAGLIESESPRAFKADYSLVSVAAFMIYGLLIGVPLATRAAIYFSGEEVSSINIRQVICVYGYSLAPTLPVSLLCLIPVQAIRWLAVLAGLALSLFFIRAHLWADVAIEAPSLKWPLAAGLGAAQAVIFGVYRIKFFEGK